MDPLHFCIAIVPLAVYLLLIGAMNLRGRPIVTTGARDAAALAIGVAGFVIAGPMQLFFPEGAASRFGGWVWLMLIVFYGLCISLVVLLMRSRIVVYNITLEQLRPVLTNVATKLDKRSRWTGDSLLMPDLRVHLHVEPSNAMRNVQLTAGGIQQSYEGWQKLEKELEQALRGMRVGPNVVGMPLVIASAFLALTSLVWMLSDQPAVAKALEQLWRQ